MDSSEQHNGEYDYLWKAILVLCILLIANSCVNKDVRELDASPALNTYLKEAQIDTLKNILPGFRIRLSLQ